MCSCVDQMMTTCRVDDCVSVGALKRSGVANNAPPTCSTNRLRQHRTTTRYANISQLSFPTCSPTCFTDTQPYMLYMMFHQQASHRIVFHQHASTGSCSTNNMVDQHAWQTCSTNMLPNMLPNILRQRAPSTSRTTKLTDD